MKRSNAVYLALGLASVAGGCVVVGCLPGFTGLMCALCCYAGACSWFNQMR